MLVLNPHGLNLSLFEGTPYSEELMSSETVCVYICIKYYKDKKNKYAKVIVKMSNELVLSCYLKLPKDKEDVNVSSIQQDCLDYIIIRDELNSDTLFVNLDESKQIKPKLYNGDEGIHNESYINYFNCHKSVWNNNYNIKEGLLGIEVEENDANMFYFIKYNFEIEQPYFLVMETEEIYIYGESDLYLDDNLIRLIDFPNSEKRERLYLDSDNIIRIVNRSKLDYNQIEFALEDLTNPDFSHKSPGENFIFEIYKNQIVIIKIMDNIEKEVFCYLIYNYNKENKSIMNFSDNEKLGDESKFIVLKQSRNDNPIIINLLEKIVIDIPLKDNVFNKETIHTDASLTNNGKYLYIMGNIHGKIPYFNVYSLDLKKSLAKRIKNKFATNYFSTAESYWKKDKLVLMIDEIVNDPKFEIINNELVMV